MGGRIRVLVAAVVMGAAACNNGGGSDEESVDGTGSGTGTTASVAMAECSPDRPADAGTTERTLEYDELARSYLVTVPESYDGARRVPLVLNLHGFNGDGAGQNTNTAMPEIAGGRGYVVVAPDGGPLKIPGVFAPEAGEAEEFEGQPFWNVFGEGDVDFGPPRGQNLGIDSSEVGADDVGFVDALLDELETELCLDAGRLYATGMSNGAGMATTLGCALGNRFAAIAPVAGVNLTGKCPESEPVPVLAVHGDADDVVLYDGNGLLGYEFGNPSVPERMAEWAERGGCDPVPASEEPEPGLSVERWEGCIDGVDIELWTIAGWNHAWPRAATPGEPGIIDATDTVLEFFDTHARP